MKVIGLQVSQAVACFILGILTAYLQGHDHQNMASQEKLNSNEHLKSKEHPKVVRNIGAETTILHCVLASVSWDSTRAKNPFRGFP